MRGNLRIAALAALVTVPACDSAEPASRPPGHEAPNSEDPRLVDTAAISVSEDACADPGAQMRPFVITWSADQRSALEREGESRIAVVSVDGCEVRPLPSCGLEGAYTFRETSADTERLMFRSQPDLEAAIPFALPQLQRHASANDRLALEYRVRGIQHATRPAVFRSDLGPGCDDATHFVLNYEAGAYRLDRHAARASVEQGATADLDAESVLFSGGDVKRCPEPGACSTPVRVRLVPISEGEPPQMDETAAQLARADLSAGTRKVNLDRKQIAQVVRYARPALVGCVRSHTVEDDAPVGKITYDFTISETGTVAGAAPTVVGQMPPEFVECTTDVLYSLRFPRSRDVVRVRYPLEFKPPPAE